MLEGSVCPLYMYKCISYTHVDANYVSFVITFMATKTHKFPKTSVVNLAFHVSNVYRSIHPWIWRSRTSDRPHFIVQII